MKHLPLLLLFFAITLMTSSCVRNFKTHDYEVFATDHQTIAVLPYEVILLGKRYSKLSPEEIDDLKISNSNLFYHDLHNQIIKKTGNKKRTAVISVQPLQSTISRLSDAGINALNINEYPATKLKNILEVDAILRPKLFTEKFLSRTESFLVDTAIDIAADIIKAPRVRLPNRSIAKASETKVIASIEDTDDDVVVWRYDNNYEQDWTDEVDKDIASVNRNIAKYFPYRNKN